MSDTPETDEASFDYDSQCEYWVDAEFARKLERERDSLKSKNAKLYNIAKTAIRYLSQSYRNEFADEVRELRSEIDQLNKEAK